MKNNIKFYMVPASPWSFLSFDRIEKISSTYNLEVELIPIDIFKLFEMQEIKMVSKRPEAIQKNRLRELQRWQDHLNIKFNIKPKFWPVNPIRACKLIIASTILYSMDKYKTFVLAKKLSEAVWINDVNTDNDNEIFKIAKEVVDVESIKNIYFDSKVASILESNTSNAFKNDIFGVPTFLYNGQVFWGQDRIFFLEKEIKKSNE